jgi:hypothetical protein
MPAQRPLMNTAVIDAACVYSVCVAYPRAALSTTVVPDGAGIRVGPVTGPVRSRRGSLRSYVRLRYCCSPRVRRVRPRKGGEWHRRQLEEEARAITTPRATERHGLREGLRMVRYKETGDQTPTTGALAARKRRMRNEMAVGERLRQWQHSTAPAAEGPRNAQPEGIT